MIKKVNRLTKQKEFDKVFKEGKSKFDKTLGIKVLSNELGYNRFGILVGLKVSKTAVGRNKIKRRLREVLRLNNHYLKQGYDMVVVTLPPAKDANFEDFKKNLEYKFRNLNLYKG